MFYCYIILSPDRHLFYVGFTKNLKRRLQQHNNCEVKSTKAYTPWKLAWYGAFQTKTEAEDFEKYLKSGSGRAFAYKRLVSVALKKGFSNRWPGSPKLIE